MFRYQLLDVLGEGAVATVWRAIDLLNATDVAIKVFHPGLQSDGMMRREVAMLRMFSHPNVVRLLGTAQVEGRPAIVLELMNKGALSQFLGRPLEVDLALRLCCRVADTVALIHDGGGVHRDVKPENILVDAVGALKLADFGLGNAPQCTVMFTCDAGGTPGYLAPEVARGFPCSPASDVFSLAVTLFEMLTGIRPIDLCRSGGLSPETLNLRHYRSDIPEGLTELIAEATAIDPSARPRARQFRESLVRILSFLARAAAWETMLPVVRVLRAKVRPLGKGIPGLHGKPFVLRGEFFDFVTLSPWHPEHGIQAYHITFDSAGRPKSKELGAPFYPSAPVPASRTVRIFMGDAPEGHELFSLDRTDQSGYQYAVFLGCGHELRDDGADAIVLVDTRNNEILDLGIYREVPAVGELLIRTILRQCLPIATGLPVGLPLALPPPKAAAH